MYAFSSSRSGDLIFSRFYEVLRYLVSLWNSPESFESSSYETNLEQK